MRFTELKLKAEEGIEFQQTLSPEGIVIIEAIHKLPEEKVAFHIPGTMYSSGDVRENNFTIKDYKDNFFTFVPGNKKCKSFYVSTYEISKDPMTGELRSIKGVEPWIGMSFEEALKEAEKFGGTLLSRKQYERICRYMIETGAVAQKDVFLSSTMCGNYELNPESPRRVAETGSYYKWIHNGIADFFGNAACWTVEEIAGEKYAVRRGGCYDDCLNPIANVPAWNRYICDRTSKTFADCGFRIVLDKEHYPAS